MSTAMRTPAEDAGYGERWRLFERSYAESSRKTTTRATMVAIIVFAVLAARVALLLMR